MAASSDCGGREAAAGLGAGPPRALTLGERLPPPRAPSRFRFPSLLEDLERVALRDRNTSLIFVSLVLGIAPMSSRLVELDACPPLRVELAAGPPLTLAGGRPVNLVIMD